MKTIDELMPLMRLLGQAMAKYALIDRQPFDFGTGSELYPAEIHLVSTVDALGEAGVTELAREFGVTKGAVSQQVTKLVEKGLLEKKRDPENGARVVITTTDRGRLVSENHLAFHMKHDQRFLEYMARLNPKSYAVVEEMAKQMNLWMDNYLK